jgi:anti-sigma factor RsiW
MNSLTHKEAFELLPWYVNETLEEDERRDVRAHLSNCLVCRRELAFLEQLDHAIVESPDVDFTPQRSFAALMRRIDIAEAPLPQRLWAKVRAGMQELRSAHPVLRGTLVVQTAMILLAAFLLVRMPLPDRSPSFETLSDAPVAVAADPASARLRVVFAPDVTINDVEALLGAGARIVDGPSSVGAFAIDVPSAASDEWLERLRTDARVRFAEPAVSGVGQ